MKHLRIKFYLINGWLGSAYQTYIDAMEVIDEINIPEKRKSFAYDVISFDSGKRYPPPLLIEEAYKIACNKTLPPNFFKNIGAKSPHFKKLKELGFMKN